MLCFDNILKLKYGTRSIFYKTQGLGIESLNVNPEDPYIVRTVRNELEKKKKECLIFPNSGEMNGIISSLAHSYHTE